MNSADILVSGLQAAISTELSEQIRKAIIKKCNQIQDKITAKYGDHEQLLQVLGGLQFDPESKRLITLLENSAKELKFDNDYELQLIINELSQLLRGEIKEETVYINTENDEDDISILTMNINVNKA